jgi:hypothetical protein
LIRVLAKSNAGNGPEIVAFNFGNDLKRLRQLRHRKQPYANLSNEIPPARASVWVAWCRDPE